MEHKRRKFNIMQIYKQIKIEREANLIIKRCLQKDHLENRVQMLLGY